jgi:hypothetical protein
MLWWILLLVIAFLLVMRHLWRAYSHPYNMLARQAANMNWVAAGTMKYSDGTRNIRLRRGAALAEISFKDVNIRLLQPEVEQIFRDFIEVERWLSKEESANHQPTAKLAAISSSKSRKDVDYFDKICSLLAVKNARENFKTLQGWDKEYGRATTRVCAMAELANENPAVVASFMLESMDRYHRNHDVALSYLARLESGFQAKLENPALAAEMDAEAQVKEESDELFKSVKLDSNSPEATYIREVNEFMRSTGYYDSLVVPALKHEGFMKALTNVYLAGYSTSSSAKVVGALIADGANKYKSNPEFGLVFLDKIATNMRKRHDDALRATTVTERVKSATATIPTERKPEAQEIEDEAAAYHAAIDRIAVKASTYLFNTGPPDFPELSDEPKRLYAELLLYLATSKARTDTRSNIHPSIWNTFKRGVEIRMLDIRDDGHQSSSVIRTPDGRTTYAHFTSTYWQRMDDLEDILNKRGAPNLIQHLLSEMEADPDRLEQFLEFFNDLSNQSASDLIPKIAAIA